MGSLPQHREDSFHGAESRRTHVYSDDARLSKPHRHPHGPSLVWLTTLYCICNGTKSPPHVSSNPTILSLLSFKSEINNAVFAIISKWLSVEFHGFQLKSYQRKLNGFYGGIVVIHITSALHMTSVTNGRSFASEDYYCNLLLFGLKQ